MRGTDSQVPGAFLTIEERSPTMDANRAVELQEAQVAGARAKDSGAERSLAGAVTRLAAGRASILVGSLIATPILARLYSPECFGTLAVIATLLAVLTPVTSLTYVTAMPLAESASQRQALFTLSVVLGLVGTVVLVGAVALGGNWVAAAFGVPDLKRYLFFVPVLYLITALALPMDMALRCQREFGKVLRREMVTNGSTRLVQIVAGLLGTAGSAGGLVLGQVAGAALGAVFMAPHALRLVFSAPRPAHTVADVRDVAVRFRAFPLYQLGSQVLNALTAGLPMFVIGVLFPAGVLGTYAVTSRLLFVPGALFASAAADVFYVEAAIRSRTDGKATAAAEELLRLVLLFTAFPLTAVLALGPLLFTIVLGPAWREAGVFAQILVPWVAVTALAQPLSSILLVENRLGENLAYNLVLMAARLSALITGAFLMGPRAALALFVAASLLVFGALIIRTLPMARLGRYWAVSAVLRAYGEAAILTAPATFCYWILGSPLLALAAIIAGTAGYAVLVYRRHPPAARLLGVAKARLGRSTAMSMEDNVS